MDSTQRRRPYRPGDLVAPTRFRVVRELGAGGMAVAYEVVNEDILARAVIKVPFPDRVRGGGYSEAQLKQEARALVQVGASTENVVRVQDFGVDAKGLPYLVMELLRGQTLAQVLSRRRASPNPTPIDTVGAVAAIFELSLALAITHKHGIIHRDVKPSNVFSHLKQTQFQEKPIVVIKLMDFGILAFLDAAADGLFVGTPRYAAPEQLNRRAVTTKTDMYALGLILFELLTLEGPFDGDDPNDVARVVNGHRHLPAPSLREVRERKGLRPVPRLLVELVAALLSKDPELRPDAIVAAKVLEGVKKELETTAPTYARSFAEMEPTDQYAELREAMPDTSRQAHPPSGNGPLRGDVSIEPSAITQPPVETHHSQPTTSAIFAPARELRPAVVAAPIIVVRDPSQPAPSPTPPPPDPALIEMWSKTDPTPMPAFVDAAPRAGTALEEPSAPPIPSLAEPHTLAELPHEVIARGPRPNSSLARPARLDARTNEGSTSTFRVAHHAGSTGGVESIDPVIDASEPSRAGQRYSWSPRRVRSVVFPISAASLALLLVVAGVKLAATSLPQPPLLSAASSEIAVAAASAISIAEAATEETPKPAPNVAPMVSASAVASTGDAGAPRAASRAPTSSARPFAPPRIAPPPPSVAPDYGELHRQLER